MKCVVFRLLFSHWCQLKSFIQVSGFICIKTFCLTLNMTLVIAPETASIDELRLKIVLELLEFELLELERKQLLELEKCFREKEHCYYPIL